MKCANPECTQEFEPAVHNQRYHEPACKSRHEVIKKRISNPVTHDDDVDLSDEEIIQLAQGRGYHIFKERSIEPTVKLAPLKTDHYKLGVISDTHMGSVFFQKTFLHDAYRQFEDEGCEVILHAGDLVHGSSHMHKGMEYEVMAHGADAQIDYAVNEYPLSSLQTYIIDGNHDLSFMKDAGLNVVRQVAQERPDFTYLGSEGAFFTIGGAKIYMWHGGSTAHAKSWNVQKWSEAVSPENKPHVMVDGHLHYACHVPAHRNIELFQLPCTQAQTPFEKRKRLNPVIGALILDLWVSKDGVEDLQTKWIIKRIPLENDY